MKKIFTMALVLAIASVFAVEAAAQGDLAWFQLKGKVMSCAWRDARGMYTPDYDTPTDVATTKYRFTKAGRLSKINGEDAITEFSTSPYAGAERDAKGRVKELSVWSMFEPGMIPQKFTYDANGRLTKMVQEDVVAEITTLYYYNAKGQVSKVTVRYVYDFTDYDRETLIEREWNKLRNNTLTVTYTYLSTDTNGNWTKRTATASTGKKWTETRTIQYYQ